MSASCSQELLSLLGRVDALAILASAALSEVALQLKVAMEGRGCAVAAAVEGCSRVEPPRVTHVQVVLILGDSPKDPDAFNPQGKLGAAAGLAFAAIASGAPVRALGGTTGLEDVRSLIEDLKQHPLPSAVESQHRWAETLAAALADDAEQLEDSLESWPELLVCRDSTGDTLLHRVASAGALEAAYLLIERGADANLRNGDEATAGDLAFRAGRQRLDCRLWDLSCVGPNCRASDSEALAEDSLRGSCHAPGFLHQTRAGVSADMPMSISNGLERQACAAALSPITQSLPVRSRRSPLSSARHSKLQITISSKTCGTRIRGFWMPTRRL